MPVTPAGFESFDEGTRLRALRGALADPRFVLTGIGALMVKEGQKAFREQRLGNVVWKSRGETGMNPNWPGIIGDFARGAASPPARRFQDRPALVDNGALWNSLSFRLVSRDTVEAGSRLPYAGVLHGGGESQSPTITLTVRQRLWKWIKGLTGARLRAEDAPERREKREVSGAVKGDAELARLKTDLQRSKASYKGQKVPKGERERRQGLETKIRERRAAVERAAVGQSASMTGAEASKIGAARHRESVASSLKWLLNPHLVGRSITIRHPARPIIGIPAGLIAEIEAIYGRTVSRAA